MEKNKTIKMDGTKAEPQKLTYEQLNEAAIQLATENQKLKEEIQNIYMINTFKRLDYLFKVVDSSYPFDVDFVSKCAKEIESMMIAKDDSTPNTENIEDEEK